MKVFFILVCEKEIKFDNILINIRKIATLVAIVKD